MEHDWIGSELEAEFLTDTAIIYERGEADDDMGGGSDTWTAIDELPCQLQAERTRLTQVEAGAQEIARALWTCYLPRGIDVDPDWRLTINDEGYEIVEADEARTRGVLIAVFLARLS